MLPFFLGIALIVQAAPQDEADKAAAELLKRVEDKILAAKTLHVEFEMTAAAGAARGENMKGEIRIGENGAFSMKASITRRHGKVDEVALRSDGRIILGTSPRPLPDFSAWKPASIQRALRRAIVHTNILVVMPVYGRSIDPDKLFDDFAATDVKAEGKEKVGDVEATKVSLVLNPKDGPRNGLTVMLWIDPTRLTILKRFIQMDSPGNETMPRFEIDPTFAAEAFEIQTEAMLKEGRTIQLARAVLVHARYTGRLPKTLEDLKRRPADLPADVFWPDTGFWIGGAIPKDIPYAATAADFTVGSIKEAMPDVSPVGAPSDRLKKFFNARVAIHLLNGAAHGYIKAHGANPRNPRDLVAKPGAARFWPEGGWVGGGKLPVDPWGDPYMLRTGSSFAAMIAHPKGRMLKLHEITPEERMGLEEVALPALGEKDAADIQALIAKLGSEKLLDREEATKALIAKGEGVLRPVAQRLAGEKDPEVASRLGLITDHFRSLKRMWISEIKGQRFSLANTGGDLASIPNNERNGMIALKWFTTAQADFRSNDRDGNRQMDFYVRDVAGLYALVGATGLATEAKPGKDGDPVMKLIELDAARADATEGRWEYPILATPEPEPRAGYLYSALKNFEKSGKSVAYHNGDGRNVDQFAFVAYPAEYGVTGRQTFIVNEDNTIWAKDLGGEEVDTFPENPGASGWAKLD